MPLNKLENFIKNTDGRTIYVNPADLNATDSITNQGTSLTEPFRTIQRALIEAARFSYVRGEDNDLIERTTILLYPGEHLIDNRPGYGIKTIELTPGVETAVAVSPSGEEVDPFGAFNLTGDTNFDVNSPNNILNRFNSIEGGAIVPRGTSIVGLDLRKTKIRPLYVPNPTDPAVAPSALFRITGTCYFWQFTIFDGEENTLVYTDPQNFSNANRSLPTFSHHKLTCFEYADGVNPQLARGFQLTDLAMYYSKLSNAYNETSGRSIGEKYPEDPEGFAPRRPEFEIVGAFATDPILVSSIISGDGLTPSVIITVDTPQPHGLDVDTPIKIRGVSVSDYNISTKVISVLSTTRFTYNLSLLPPNLPATPGVSSANITVETDTVTGASPYIFNISLRSVWGMNGMNADGAKASGFRSMVVAQFTAISLQKDDRAFVKYNVQNRNYESIQLTTQRGAELSANSSSTNTARVYHLDPFAIYRPTWGTTHMLIDNDAIMQIVSVFAIGFNQHFAAKNGGDASITNSNSNFGQFSLLSEGFKNDAFEKDNQGFISQIVTPNNAFNPNEEPVENIAFINIDYELVKSRQGTVGTAQIYLSGFTNPERTPPSIIQGFRPGANNSDAFFQGTLSPELYSQTLFSADILMVDNRIDENNFIATGSDVAKKSYNVIGIPNSSELEIGPNGLTTGESIRLISGNGDLPGNVELNTLYYAIVQPNAEFIQIATSESNALNGINLQIFGGSQLRIESRVNDKNAGELGHPIQYDFDAGNWFIHTNNNSEIFRYITGTGGFGPQPPNTEGNELISFFRRENDTRSLDDKIYRLRYVIPRSTVNSKPPTAGYILQDSSSTGYRTAADVDLQTLTVDDYGYDRNLSLIKNCVFQGSLGTIECTTEKPHGLSVGDKVKILNITSTNNPTGSPIQGFNGQFLVTQIGDGSGNQDAKIFRYSATDVNGFLRNPGTFTNDINNRNTVLPRFERKDNQLNLFAYRVEEISPFIENIRDGIYHLFCINGANAVPEEFTESSYNQPVEYFYPQLDRDNVRNNPESTTTFANRSPLGKVTINELQNSLTRESLDRLYEVRNNNIISFVTSGSPGVGNTFISQIQFEREHNFNGLYDITLNNAGTNYPTGKYYSVNLLSNSGSLWKGATATIEISGGNVIDFSVSDIGSNYNVGETLVVPSLGGDNNIEFEVSQFGIEDNRFTGVQITGGGEQNPDTYSYITEIIDTKTVEVIRNSEAPGSIIPGMFLAAVDCASPIQSYNYNPNNNIDSTITVDDTNLVSGMRYGGVGLQRGNSFVVFRNNGSFAGKFYVDETLLSSQVPTVVNFRSVNNLGAITGGKIVKCGLEDNDASTGSSGENIGVRGTPFFDNGIFYTVNSIQGNDTQIALSALFGEQVGSVSSKLPLGTYLQIGSEIIRVSSTTFTGPSNNITSVIRGALGTFVSSHPQGSKVKKIKPYALELRRPSILRASGHTFEYIGYGPGNYSVALPQLQVRQLPDDEIYLVQAQELAAGQVVYTGMSDNGDFYIGNIKFSSASGTQVTFDVPIPTVAGQVGSSNNVVFDEVIVNRRLFVGGGETNDILSQFDGPVKFSSSVNLISDLSVNGSTSLNTLLVESDINATSLVNGGAVTIRGGAAVTKDFFVGGDIVSAGEFRANNILADRPNDPLNFWKNQINGDIGIGTTLANGGKVIFHSLKPGTGEGGEDDIANSDAGVDIKGSLVVRDKVIAKEFIGDGLGKPGSIIMWGGTETGIYGIPDGYLLCDGAQYATSEYPKLFESIGYTHGGTGANFNVPDLRERFIVGAPTDNPTVPDSSGYPVASTGGANFTTIGIPQLPAHTHVVEQRNLIHGHETIASSQQREIGHTHGIQITAQQGTHSHNSAVTSTQGGHGHNGGTSSEGGHSHRYRRSNDNVERGNRSRRSLRDEGYNETNTGGSGAHNHSVNVGSNGSQHNHSVTVPNQNSGHNHAATSQANTGGDHDHVIEVAVEQSADTLNHNHVLEETGDGGNIDRRPPYYALCYMIQFK